MLDSRKKLGRKCRSRFDLAKAKINLVASRVGLTAVPLSMRRARIDVISMAQQLEHKSNQMKELIGRAEKSKWTQRYCIGETGEPTASGDIVTTASAPLPQRDLWDWLNTFDEQDMVIGSHLVFKPANEVNYSRDPVHNSDQWFKMAIREDEVNEIGEPSRVMGGLGEPRVKAWKEFRRREKFEGDRTTIAPLSKEPLSTTWQAFKDMMQKWKTTEHLNEIDVEGAISSFPGWVHRMETHSVFIESNWEFYIGRADRAEIIYWDAAGLVWRHEFLPERPWPLRRKDYAAFQWVLYETYGPWPQTREVSTC